MEKMSKFSLVLGEMMSMVQKEVQLKGHWARYSPKAFLLQLGNKIIKLIHQNWIIKSVISAVVVQFSFLAVLCSSCACGSVSVCLCLSLLITFFNLNI